LELIKQIKENKSGVQVAKEALQGQRTAVTELEQALPAAESEVERCVTTPFITEGLVEVL
jgi:hypothetical protein